ncbi:MAG: FAD-dependent oxidoreductase, partial [bacterium]|nr:FAD-dependent oxidoreductase [bacterium]
IVGDYTLTLDDYLARRSFEDEIARTAYYIDIHLSNDEMARDRERGRDTDERLHRYGPGESHGIPYRCLLPRSLDNVLVAGRCTITDRPVPGATSVMPVCLATGEAAGVAAAMAATRNSGDVRRIDVSEVRKCIGLPP